MLSAKDESTMLNAKEESGSEAPLLSLAPCACARPCVVKLCPWCCQLFGGVRLRGGKQLLSNFDTPEMKYRRINL